jgi:hypothetical protein
MAPAIKVVEEFGKSLASLLDILGVAFLHQRSCSARARIELADVKYSELIFIDEAHGFIELGLSFTRESANDVRGDGDARAVTDEVIANQLEFFSCVFTIHLLQDRIGPALHWDMQKREDPRMIEDDTDVVQMLQNVRRVSHADLKYICGMVP